VHCDSPTYEEAMEGPYRKEFLETMEKERQQLQRYSVYNEVSATDSPEHEKIIDPKWVILIKRKTDRTIEKFKAKKVAKRYVQEKNLATEYNINHGVTLPTTTSLICNLEK
jgi:hypothetical protein